MKIFKKMKAKINEGEIYFFRQKTVTSRCDLQEILKEFLQAEGK